MSEPQRRPRSAKKIEPPWFDVWFWRVVQIVGLLVIVREMVLREDPRVLVLGTALVMMLGARGVEKWVQAWKAVA